MRNFHLSHPNEDRKGNLFFLFYLLVNFGYYTSHDGDALTILKEKYRSFFVSWEALVTHENLSRITKEKPCWEGVPRWYAPHPGITLEPLAARLSPIVDLTEDSGLSKKKEDVASSPKLPPSRGRKSVPKENPFTKHQKTRIEVEAKLEKATDEGIVSKSASKVVLPSEGEGTAVISDVGAAGSRVNPVPIVSGIPLVETVAFISKAAIATPVIDAAAKMVKTSVTDAVAETLDFSGILEEEATYSFFTSFYSFCQEENLVHFLLFA